MLVWWSDLAMFSWSVLAQWSTQSLLRATSLQHGSFLLTTMFLLVNVLSSWWMYRQIDNHIGEVDEQKQAGRLPTILGGSVTAITTLLSWLFIWLFRIKAPLWGNWIIIALFSYIGHMIGRNWAMLGISHNVQIH